jgi:hypothetical protein
MSASSYFSGFAIGLGVGLFWGRALASVPRDQDPDFRRRFNHENTAPNSSEERPFKFKQSVTWREGPVQRGNGEGGPTTPKPEIIPRGQVKPQAFVSGEKGEYFVISYREDSPF